MLLSLFHERNPHTSLKTPHQNIKPIIFQCNFKANFQIRKKNFKSLNAEDRHKTWLKSRRYGKQKNEAADALICEVTNDVILLQG